MNVNLSMWVDVDDTWCYCKACGKYHSKPFFIKTQYCPDCGSYMQNYKKGDYLTMLTSISKGSNCSKCVHKSVCQFSTGMSEALQKLDELRTSYNSQPFDFVANCRHFAMEVSSVKSICDEDSI